MGAYNPGWGIWGEGGGEGSRIWWDWTALGDFYLVLHDFRMLFPGFDSRTRSSGDSTSKFEIFSGIT